MQSMRLTTFILALKNLRKRFSRTKSLIAIASVLAFAIFSGGLLSESLNLGNNYMSGRMGADLMAVPRGYALDLQHTLLKSESNTFYMKENLKDKISSIPGVEQVSPQLFIGSLNASCCTVPVQLIGFDPGTDFTIKSWMINIDTSKLGFGEVVTGSRVNAAVNSDIWMFGQPLKVAATLDDTGMGFDSSVFMTIETAKQLTKASEESAVHPAGSGKEQISALFIKSANDTDTSELAKSIMSQYPQLDIVVLKNMMEHISTQLGKIKGLIYGIQVLLWAVSILILTAIYNFTANERKREFGLLLAIGANRKYLRNLFMTETFIVSLIGALIGAITASFIMFEFRMLIAISLEIPYLQPTIGSTLRLVALSILISVSTGIIACIYSIRRFGRLETFAMIREYE